MTRTDTLEVDSSPMDVYLAFPGGDGPHPGVVVMHHRHGLDDFTRVISDRLAEAGFCAAAPDKYHRSEGDADQAREEITDTGIISDVAATVDHFKSQPEVDGARLGIIGHCMGGRTALVGSSANPAFIATAVWYGGNVFKTYGEVGPTAFERLGDLRGPVAGFYGNDDKNPSPDDVNRIDAELTRLGIAHEFHRYDGAGHAFMNYDGASYREEASNDSWGRAMEFLKREL